MSDLPDLPDLPDVLAWIGRVTGRPPVDHRPVAGGQTASTRLRVTLDDGSSVFVKAAALGTWEGTALTAEIAVHRDLHAPFLPSALADEIDEDQGYARLLLPDLSARYWPPPWRPGDVDAVLSTLAEVAAHPPPVALRPVAADREALDGWPKVALEPGPFARLGLGDATWMEQCLPVLVDASSRADLRGDELLHFDVRSDNLCLADDRSVQLVDWSWATRGPGALDVLAWLPSLAMEGGPMPDAVMPGADPALVALLAGMWAWNAGQPDLPSAPGLRRLQRALLRQVLPWACRCLDLPEPLEHANG